MKTLAALAVLLAFSSLAAQEPPADVFTAITAGDAAKVKKLLAADPKLAAQKNPQGFTPLHAASHRSTDVVKLLLDAKADVNAKAEDDHTPLYLAASGGSKEVVALLLDRGADVSAVTKYDRFTPLHRAAQRGHVAIITLLLAKGAAPDGGWDGKELRPALTPMHFAIREGYPDAVRLLIVKGATVDAVHRVAGHTHLYEAVERGDPELVKLLLRKGADPNRPGPLARALQSGNPELIQLFVAKGADFKADPRLLLHAAISGKKEVVERVLAAGVVLTDSENHGIAALVYAARQGHTDIVRLLLEKGVDPNITAKGYTPPLHVAATKEIAELLIKHKAKLDELDKQGASPMLAAVYSGNKAVAELLELHGAKHTLATLAALGRDDELKARLEKEPLPKEKGSDRPTLLYLAARFGQIPTARALLAAGVDVNAPDSMSETPLHAAAAHGHLALVELLLEHKADVNAKKK
jgi:ankyrin repeat protein